MYCARYNQGFKNIPENSTYFFKFLPFYTLVTQFSERGPFM